LLRCSTEARCPGYCPEAVKCREDCSNARKGRSNVRKLIELRGCLDSATTKTLLKAIDATTAVKSFLFTRIERVTLGTHFDQYVFTQSRLGLNNVAAATGGLNGAVAWMNFWFHGISSQLMSPHRTRCTTSAFILWSQLLLTKTTMTKGACILTENF